MQRDKWGAKKGEKPDRGMREKEFVRPSFQALLSWLLYHTAPQLTEPQKEASIFTLCEPATCSHSARIGCTGFTFIGNYHFLKQRFPLDQSITSAKEITINAIT